MDFLWISCGFLVDGFKFILYPGGGGGGGGEGGGEGGGGVEHAWPL